MNIIRLLALAVTATFPIFINICPSFALTIVNRSQQNCCLILGADRIGQESRCIAPSEYLYAEDFFGDSLQFFQPASFQLEWRCGNTSTLEKQTVYPNDIVEIHAPVPTSTPVSSSLSQWSWKIAENSIQVGGYLLASTGGLLIGLYQGETLGLQIGRGLFRICTQHLPREIAPLVTPSIRVGTQIVGLVAGQSSLAALGIGVGPILFNLTSQLVSWAITANPIQKINPAYFCKITQPLIQGEYIWVERDGFLTLEKSDSYISQEP